MILKCSLFNGHDCLTPGTKQSRATPRDRVRTVRLRNSKHAGEGAQVLNLNLSSCNVRPPSYVCWLTKAPVTIVTIVISTKNHSEIGVICTNLAILGASHCKRKATLSINQSIYLSVRLSIYPGWWYTYPSEKYESQLGLFFPTSGKIKHVRKHQPVSVGLSIYLSVNLSIYVQISFPSKSPIAVLSKLNRPCSWTWPPGLRGHGRHSLVRQRHRVDGAGGAQGRTLHHAGSHGGVGLSLATGLPGSCATGKNLKKYVEIIDQQKENAHIYDHIIIHIKPISFRCCSFKSGLFPSGMVAF